MKIGASFSPLQPAVSGTVQGASGLWSMTVWPGEYLKLAFAPPGRRRPRVERAVAWTLGLAWSAFVWWVLLPAGWDGRTVLVGALMLIAPIAIMAVGWQSLPINEAFIPHVVEFDLRSGMARLTDLRDDGQTIVCGLGQIESLQEWPPFLPSTALFRRLRIKLVSGRELYLPFHGVVAGPLIEPIRTFLHDGAVSSGGGRPQA